MRLSHLLLLTLLSAGLVLPACRKRSGKPRVLVFTKTAGFVHESIPAGVTAVQKLGADNGFEVDTTSNAAFIQEDSLKPYAAVVFLNTTGNVLNNYQEAAFERYIQAGGGFAGVHAATDTEYDWGWYGRLVGAYFADHPPGLQQAALHVEDTKHAATEGLPATWTRQDEYYNFKKVDSSINVLIRADEKSYQGGNMGERHPISWYHEVDGGRAFYTALGHTKESYSEPQFLKHLLGGIQYAIGDNEELDWDNARTQPVPEEDRFVKTSLTVGTLFEPTEMAILPNSDVLIAQRRGELMRYSDKDKSIKQVGYLNVYWKTTIPDVNAEEGVMGIALDPDYAKNNYIYLFYSPADTSVNRLSRFVFKNDTLDLASEKTVLQFYSQRNICCHTGGSIAFGRDRLLYLSTGDNSTPFDEPKQPYVNRGYAPTDDRPGHEQYDARRTSGNPADLRGKILRIRVKEDGSYEIPDGNLFPKNGQGARPEVFVMGNRNPYRISVDKRSGFLYWGEVGPDAAGDSLDTRGPRGYDEVNQARKAGNFGWPLFIGDNYAYRNYDYNTGTSTAAYDPARPVNNSRNNTGMQQLPPAVPAFIWYPYAASTEFPQLGTGGRNAMAGPVYYTEDFKEGTRLPEYYNGKLFIYDWIRGWIRAVTMKENGDFDKMEPFMESTRFNAPIDMETGPDGRLYVLEYGSGWFAKNADAGLARIDYISGNRAPKVAGVEVDKTSGRLPLTVTATVDVKDPENDELTYVWDLGGGVKKETREPRLQHTFSKAGEYPITVSVRDEDGASAASEPVSVFAGNSAPQVDVAVTGNQTFYFPGQPVNYTVRYNDLDGGAAAQNLIVTADYTEGTDAAGASQGHQVLTEAMTGRNLTMSLDCKACHKQAETSVGPAYTAVAERYKDKEGSSEYLVQKIIKGGAGAWGEVAMPAHPTLKESDARQIVTYIRSLSGKAPASLPPTGSVQPSLGKPLRDNGVLVISASYTDAGTPGVRPLTGNGSKALRHPRVSMAAATKLKDASVAEFNGMKLLLPGRPTSHFALEGLDLTGIASAEMGVGWQAGPQHGFRFELRLDRPDGQKIGEFVLGPQPAKAGNQPTLTALRTRLSPVTDGKQHTIYVVSTVANAAENATVALQYVQFGK